MSIPVYRHNFDYDDWEVASVYTNSDDCDSLGRSADDDSLHSGYFDDPALRSGLPGVLHDDIRRRIEYPMPIPMPQPQLQPQQQKQYENYPPMTYSPRRWETRPAGKGSGYAPPPAPIVPPPGVIFPRQDWVHSPPKPQQDPAYWRSPTPTPAGHGHYGHGQGYGIPPSVLSDSLPMYQPPPMPPPPPVADVPVGLDRVDRMELSPPGSSLLLAPSSPPLPAPCGLIRRPSLSAMIGHGQAPHATPLTMPSVQGTGIGIGSSSISMNTYTAPSPPPPPAPMMPPPPRYHEVAHHHHHNHHHAKPIPMSPRCLAEAGCQARSCSSSQSQSYAQPSSHPHPGMGTRSSSPNPRRQPGHGEPHDVLSPYGVAAGVLPRGRRSSEDTDMIGVPGLADGRYAGSGSHASHGPAGDRSDLQASSPSIHWQGKHEREEYDADGGRTRKTRPLTRERRPSIWQRFVRRFSPSRVSIGQT